MAQPNSLVLDQLRSDPYFAVDFIVDNNPEGVMANLSSLGLLSGTPQELTREQLRREVLEIEDPATMIEVTNVAYDNQATNYTGGYGNVLAFDTDPGNYTAQAKAAGVGLAIFNGITQLGSSVAQYLTGRTNVQVAEEYTEQAQINAQLALELQQQQLAFEDTQRVFGIPKSAFIVTVVSLAVVIGIGFLSRK